MMVHRTVLLTVQSCLESQQDGRLPPAYSEPSHFCKEDENGFFLEKHFIFSNFSILKIF